MTLKELQDAGSLPATLKNVNFSGAVPISVIRSRSEAELSEFTGAIVVDNCQWAAAARRIPIERANCVYSSDGSGGFGQYQKDTRTYFYKELVNGSLVTTSIFKLPMEVYSMDKNFGGGLNFSQEDFDNFTGGVAQSVTGFDGAGAASAATPTPAPSEATGEKKVSHVAEQERMINDIRKKSDVGHLASRLEVYNHNQRYGRLIAFITKTNSVVRPRITKETNKDKVVIGKNVVFRDTAPATIKGAIIATPAGSDIQLTRLGQKEDFMVDTTNNTMVIHCLDKENAMTYLAANYDGIIQESEEVLGEALASKIKINYKASQKDGKDCITASLSLESKDKRSTLLTEGNYYPLMEYKTLSTVDMSPENAAIADLNITALFGSGKNTYDELTDDSKKNLQPSGDTYTSVWFDKKQPIEVKRYDNKEADVADVRVPVREVKTTKTGKVQYKFVYHTPEEIVSLPKYRKIVKATGLSDDVFLSKVKKFTQRKSSGSRKVELTADDYLRAIKSNNIVVNGSVGGFDDIISDILSDASIQ